MSRSVRDPRALWGSSLCLEQGGGGASDQSDLMFEFTGHFCPLWLLQPGETAHSFWLCHSRVTSILRELLKFRFPGLT